MAHRRWRESLGVRASLFTDPDTKDEMAKQINVAVARMKAFDQLPPKIRQAIEQAKTRFDVIDIAKMLKAGRPEDQVLDALRNERASASLLNIGNAGTGDARLTRKRS